MYSAFTAPLPDMAAYLHRIGIREDMLKPTKENLDRLIYAQLTHVPFENLTVYREKACPDLEIPALFDKIVTRRRGGYCFELNALFYALLQAVGYDVYPVACRIRYGFDMLRPLSHRASVVTIDGKKYYADVGYGGPSAHCAVPFDGEAEGFFVTTEGSFTNICRHEEDGDKTVISFDDRPFLPIDFIPLNYQIAMAPGSYFQMMVIVNLTTDTGSKSITGDVYKCHDNGKVTEKKLASDEELLQTLKDEFGICL